MAQIPRAGLPARTQHSLRKSLLLEWDSHSISRKFIIEDPGCILRAGKFR